MNDGKSRRELYQLMYEIAKEHRDLAKAAWQDKNIHVEIKESMISVLFAFTCLDAYINYIGKDNLGPDWENYEKALPEGKWKGVTSAYAEKVLGKRQAIFNKSKEPFKSFLELGQLRTDLVHWRPEFRRHEKTKYGTGEATINRINCEKAEWACGIVEEMIKKLLLNLSKPIPRWLV